MENLINILIDMKDWNKEKLLFRLDIPHSKVNELENSFPDVIQLFLEKHPAACWMTVCYGLYEVAEYEILEVAQSKYYKGS